MALTRTRLGTNEDGSPHFHYASDGDKPVVFTGPNISGSVTLPDGTVYDVTPDFVEVEPGHEGHVAHAIGVRHQEEGHPLHGDDNPFVHTCNDNCPEG